MSQTEAARTLLAIVREIHEDGRDVIGPGWTLLDKMTLLAAQGDVAGMAEYYSRCLRSYRGHRTGSRLTAAGKKSLESEQARFLGIARPFMTSNPAPTLFE